MQEVTYLLQLKHLLALGALFLVVTIGVPDDAYGHGCEGQPCINWPNALLSSYHEIISYVLVIGMVTVVAMLGFKFLYLPRKDYYLVKYSPAGDYISRLLFKGRDKRKIFAAMPFLAFGGFLFALSLQILFTHGFAELESCAPYGMTMCQTTTYANVAFVGLLYSLPFLGVGAFLLITGIKAISLVTMKKESVARC